MKIWSQSLVARLMVPIGIMLVLVCLLGLIASGARDRLRDANVAANEAQAVRVELIEIRSLSRSLQRDALNLIVEPDPGELAVIQRKLATRLVETRALLADFAGKSTLAQPSHRAPYLAEQAIVLDQLASVSVAATAGRTREALRNFRSRVRPAEREASRRADMMIAAQGAIVARLAQRTRALELQETVISVVASTLLFALAALATSAIARKSVARPLADIETALGSVADGQTDGRTPHIDREDEIGRMARAIEVFRSSVRERERLRVEQTEARTAELQRERARERHQRGIEEQEAARSRTIAIAAEALHRDVESALGRLRTTARQLSGTSTELARHSATSTRELGEVKSSVARAADGATDIAAATHQFMSAIGISSENTRQTADLTTDATRHVVVLADQMMQVQRDASSVGKVVDLIGGIAKRTNLLALNATIEATRAGDAGKGFAVVAGEVKALAEQTARATDDIAMQVTEMQDAAREAGANLARIGTMIAQVAAGSNAVASSIEEQARSGQTIDRNIAGAANVLETIDSRVSEVSVSAKGVEQLAGEVRGDALLVETTAATIDDALSHFSAQLATAG